MQNQENYLKNIKIFQEDANPELVQKALDFCKRDVPSTKEKRESYIGELLALQKEITEFTGITYNQILCFLFDKSTIPDTNAIYERNTDLLMVLQLLIEREVLVYSNLK